ncbi:acyl-CoA dehydrogenase family protein [Streptomyces sp. KLOTTS4A1]|uniref:acyl-CoA dehydrogenase family protein n=1 Tax=Streptomyces sp. KLOTTS4A1 TaxID=3390996 RepID=UPI0039F5BB10
MTTPRDLLYSETEDELRAAVRSLLTDRCAPAQVVARAESGEPHDRDLWKTLASDMGLAGLLVPESLGGQGAGAREAAVVLEELGRRVAPVPYLTSAVIATETLLGCASTAAEELVGALAAGRSVGILALPLSTAPSASYARIEETGGRLTGRITAVADAASADVLLVPAGSGLYAVDTTADGVHLTAQTPLDLTRPLSVLTLESAPGRLLAAAGEADSAVRRGLRAGAALLASEQLGLADWCLTETVAYTKSRNQFNRPVGSFQALKHRLAELWLQTVHARAAARNAADALVTGSHEAPLAASLAQAYCSPVAVHAAEEALQLHGGIGMTWEHPVHLYLKRAKTDSIALGTAGAHREAVAELVDLQAP